MHKRIANKVLPKNSLRRSIAKRLLLQKYRGDEYILRKYLDDLTYREKTQDDLLYYNINAKKTKFSIISPLFNTPDSYLYDMVFSVIDQSYKNWELIIVNASTDESRISAINDLVNIDSRIKVYSTEKNLGISGNTNFGISKSKGEYIGFIDHDDKLARNALAINNKFIIDNDYPDVLYSDEDKLSEDGAVLKSPFYKPAFSQNLLCNVNYINHFTVVKKNLVDSVGGLSPEYDGAQDYEFLLRLVSRGARFVHIPEVLYHWREARGSTATDFSKKTSVMDRGEKALNSYLKLNNINAEASQLAGTSGHYKVGYRKPNGSKYRVLIYGIAEEISEHKRQSTLKPDNDLSVEYIKINDKFDSKSIVKTIAQEDGSTCFVVSANVLPFTYSSIYELLNCSYNNPRNIYMPLITDGSMHILSGGFYRLSKNLYIDILANTTINQWTDFGNTSWVRDIDATSALAFALDSGHVNDIEINLKRMMVTSKNESILWAHSRIESQQRYLGQTVNISEIDSKYSAERMIDHKIVSI